MKIIVNNPTEPNELRRFVARLEFIWGDGVRITTHKQPMTAADMRALANALNLAADGFERGDAEETVRDLIEGKAGVIPIEQIDEHLRLVSVGGEEFMLMSKYMPSQFGEYVWNATRLGTGIGTGGFAASSVEGFAAAEKEAARMLAGASRAADLMTVMDMVDSAQGEINADDPQFRSTQLGRIEEPPLDPESDTLPLGVSDESEVDDIPDDVLEGLSVVRDSAVTNMLDKSRVLSALKDEDYVIAALWLEDHPDRYMDALNEMGSIYGR